MAETPISADRQALEALKSLGKTLGQMTLYKIGHPAVAATLQAAEKQLTEALTQTNGALAFSVDGDKLLANGRIIGAVRDLPSALGTIFTRFKLSSMTFRPGVTNKDLAAFCELTAVRPGAAQALNPVAFFVERGVSNIVFNEAVYTKAGATTPPPSVRPQAGGTAADAQSTAEVAQAILSQSSMDRTIETLVERAVPDAAQRGAVFEKVMQLLRDDVERRVEEVAKQLRHEKGVLQNEQARTNSVLSTMVEGVVMVDEAGKILMMNPAAEQLYGASLAEVAGQPLTSKTSEEHMITLAKELTTPAGDRAVAPQVDVAGVDDTRRTIKSAGAVVQNQEGKVVGMVSQLTDAAKHKELQRMQRDFIAHVTHELRAPLSSIRAALEILQGEVADKMREEENRMLQTALKNADRLADLINSILDFSKIESGQMTVFPKKYDAERIARDGVDSLGAWAAKKRLNLSLVTSPGLPPVAADAPRVVQVLVNLLSNAIKFTPVGGSITVRCGMAAERAGGERFVQYSVTDTGSGIPKAEQKRVFEKFVQIAAGEMHVGGTGLGLAIAKALVHLHGGKMWLESEPGQGATFLFTLPVYTEPKEPTQVKEAPKAVPWWKRLLGVKG